MSAMSKKQTQTLTIVVLVGIVMLVGAILWILSLEGIVTGFWANMMSVIFTFLGVLYGLLQWLAQLAEQQAMDMRGSLSSASDALARDQGCCQAERLTSHATSSPLIGIPCSSTPLPSVMDSQLATALRWASATHDGEQGDPFSERGINIHIHIYH